MRKITEPWDVANSVSELQFTWSEAEFLELVMKLNIKDKLWLFCYRWKNLNNQENCGIMKLKKRLCLREDLNLIIQMEKLNKLIINWAKTPTVCLGVNLEFYWGATGKGKDVLNSKKKKKESCNTESGTMFVLVIDNSWNYNCSGLFIFPKSVWLSGVIILAAP